MKKWIALLSVVLIWSLPTGASNTAVKRGGVGGATLVGGGPAASPADSIFTFPDIDDEPGVADGAGADDAPHPGSQVGKIRFGMIRSNPETANINTLSDILTYNYEGTPTGGTWENPNLASSGITMEHSYSGGAVTSGAPWTEYYWQHNPASYYMTFANTATTATTTLGDQYTFTNLANCRAMKTGENLDNSTARFNCVDGVEPADNDFVTGCTGVCNGDESGAQVSTSVRDASFRPFFYELFSDINRVNWSQRKGLDGSGSVAYYINAVSAGEGHLYLGRGSATDTNDVTVNIPLANQYTNDAHVSGGAYLGGDISIDTTDDGGATGYFFFIANNADDNTGNYGLHPTQTHCFEDTSTHAVTADDRFMPMTGYQRIKLVAFGCGNNTNDAAGTTTDGTFTLEDGAGNAITLSGTLTCAPKDSAMAWVTIDPDTEADSILTTGERLRFDTVVAPNPDTDDLSFCVAYQYYMQ